MIKKHHMIAVAAFALSISSVLPVYAAGGWQKADAIHWCYVDPASGERVTGWLELEGVRYYLDEEGVLQTGFFTVGTTGSSLRSYETDADGAVICSRVWELEGKTVRAGQDGVLMFQEHEPGQPPEDQNWKYVRNAYDRGALPSNPEELREQAKVLEDAYFEQYQEKVLNEKSSVDSDRQNIWVKKVRSELSALVPSEQAESYIEHVKDRKFYPHNRRKPGRDDAWYDDFYSEYSDPDSKYYVED